MLDSSLASLKIPWLQASERLAPCSQLVAKTKKTPFYGSLTSGFAVHCVYSGLPILHGDRPDVPKPTRKNNFRRVQLPTAPPEEEASNSSFTRMSLRLCIGWGTPDGVPFPFPLPWNAVFCVLRRFKPVGVLVYPSGFFRALKRLWSGLRAFERPCASRVRSMRGWPPCGRQLDVGGRTEGVRHGPRSSLPAVR